MIKLNMQKREARLSRLKFAEELRRLGMTQEEFAEESGISVRSVRILLTEDKNVSVNMASNISRVFGVTIEDLLVITETEDY